MKAIVCTRYGSPEVFKLQEVEKPSPRNNEVSIKIFATCVTASDCIVRGFKLSRWSPMGFMMGLMLGFTKPRNPVLGLVLAGEIDALGSSAKRFKQHDRVYAFTMFRFGAYAEYTCLAETSMITPMPSGLSYEEAAAIPYGGLMALHFLQKASVQSGQRVLIYGASGAIGTAAVQLAKHFGAVVTGVCSTANLELVLSLGADHVIDYTKEDATSGEAVYDLILDTAGKGKTSAFKTNCRKALAPNGKYVSIDDGNPSLQGDKLNVLTELVESGKFKPVIDRCYPLEQMIEAHRYVETGRKKGNVVITVRPAQA